eukprot:TRINITY_DN63380_c0_g1_i1.p1 TRINITY_DN63380_c0_g1~~TRINITY_DN63380_c0_g1_i1.p1  ORF type:complete len:373 (+),score=64.65 TRINITY_DN63380_c0_g1_i1:71-1189(+)
MAQHPFRDQTFILANRYPGYVGYYLGATPGEIGMRGNRSRAEATRVTLHAVEEKPNTYHFQCCTSGYNSWISFEASTYKLKLSGDKAEAMPIELVDAMMARKLVKMKHVGVKPQGADTYVAFSWDGCWLRAYYDHNNAVPVRLEDPNCEIIEEPFNVRLAVDNACESISLPNVQNSTQTHACQPWFTQEIAVMSGGRLRGKWKDQGWGNRKGAIHARLVDTDGTALYAWQLVGDYPAEHDWADIDCEIPSEFFSGEVPVRDECAEFQARRPTPEGARLELGFEVGGGGGHSLHIKEASLLLFAPVKALQAIAKESEIVICTLGGEELAAVSIGAEDSDESRASKIRTAVRDSVAPHERFKVIVHGTQQVISG